MIKCTPSFFQFISCLLIALLSSCESSVEVSPWDVVDGNSVLVFESKGTPILPDKKYGSYFINKTNLYLLVVQRSSKNDFDIAYAYAISKERYDSLLTQKSSTHQKRANRQFNGIEINEIKNESNEIEFSFAYISGVFVLSKSPLLVENAIRAYQSKENKNFRKRNEALFQFPALKSDQGNVYINSNRIAELFAADFTILKSIPILNELKNVAVYDVKSDKDFISLNGFSIGDNSSMSLFQKQKPISFKVARYIPNQATSLVHFGASDFQEFKNVIDSAFMREFSIGHEITFASLGQNMVAFIESDHLDGLKFITDYSESYSTYHIRSVDGILLKKNFGKLFPEKPFNFCTVKDGYLIFSYSVEDIKSLIDAIENDNTWGKTLEYQKFSERGLQESNVTIILRNPKILSGSTGLSKSYSGIIDSLGLSRIRWYSVQMSALDNHFYSNINISLGSLNNQANESVQQIKSSSIELTGDVKFALLVKNHNTGSQEVFVQDSDFWIYLFSPNEGVLWKRQIGGRINGSLQQVDYYKNGKLQYFFSANNKLYLIDRLGRDVSGFPKTLSSSIKNSGVIDYDKSRNYRFLVSLSGNEVYLLDKDGKNLGEWGPKKFDKEIAYPPQHFKVAGKDYFMVFLLDGNINVFNRRGDRVKSFEIKSKGTLSGDYHIESGMSFSETHLHYLTKEGSVIKQNMDGKAISSDNLLRGKNSKFVLKRIINLDGYYIYRVDTDKLVVFDSQANIVFEKPNNASTSIDFQCVDLGNNKKAFAFLDEEQKLVQILDEAGNNLMPTPIESDILPLFVGGKQESDWGVYSFPKNSVVFNSIKE